MSMRQPMRSLHMGCGESLQRALSDSSLRPVTATPATNSQPTADKVQATREKRKPGCS